MTPFVIAITVAKPARRNVFKETSAFQHIDYFLCFYIRKFTERVGFAPILFAILVSIMLTDYLTSKGLNITEGHSGQLQKQKETLVKLASTEGVRKILEIGFNAGHSAETFLTANPNATLTSFDIGHHDYTRVGKEYIDATFPGRHTLILGDSQKTVAEFYLAHPNEKFDVIFVDGGHEYECAMSDLLNCVKLAHEGTILIIDDIVYDKQYEAGYTIGPTRAWTELKEQGSIIETEYALYGYGRGQAVGKYVL